jgi:hypothetical protein
MNGYKKLVSTFLFTTLAITLVVSVPSSLSSVFLIAKANLIQTTPFNDVSVLRLVQQPQFTKNVSPELLKVNATLKPANTANIANTNQTGPANAGIQFLGQTNVKTLKPFVPPTKVLVRITPFHPTNPVAFAKAKRLAELNLTRPQVRIFSGQHPINRTGTVNNTSIQSSVPISPLTSSSTGFDGLTQSQAGFNGFIINPPDVQHAAGSKYLASRIQPQK